MLSNRTATRRCAPQRCPRLPLVAMALVTASALFITKPIRAQDDLHVQYKFDGLGDGASPIGNLLPDGYSHVLGVASEAGAKSCAPFPGCGVVFDWAHGFLVPEFNFGSLAGMFDFPTSGLVRDTSGNLYGEMEIQYQLNVNTGAIYKILPSGTAEVVHTFPLQEGFPTGGLTLDSKGNLYGVTTGNGSNGEIFKITPAGITTVLFQFTDPPVTGSSPQTTLAIDADGNLYGTAVQGGQNGTNSSSLGYGVLFKLSPDGTFTVLHYFTNGADGGDPNSIVLDDKGNIYGFTDGGGDRSTCSLYNNGAFASFGCGVLYEYDTSGNFTVLHSFTGFDGAGPQGIPLILGDTVYGATQSGGVRNPNVAFDGFGVVFQITQDGTETILHSFTGKDGESPSTGLIQLPNGDIYGATLFGGHSSISTNPCSTNGTVGCGVLYKILLPK